MELPILHVDMNAFYASCHQAEDKSLRGKPVIVAGDPERRHGIVLTASYEARRFGVKTAMPNWEARRLCPEAVFISPDYCLYLDFSRRALEIMRQFTPLVEPFSIDEAWLDVTGVKRIFGSSPTVARALKERIRAELGLTCSVGVSANKLLAKMASEMEKPDGLTVLKPADISRLLWPRPVKDLLGVGRRVAVALEEMGISTIGALAALPVDLLRQRFGVMGEMLFRFANGQDESPVDPSAGAEVKSVGNSITLSRDIGDLEEIAGVLLALCEQVGTRLRQQGLLARTVQVTVKDQNFKSSQRHLTMPVATDLTADIYRNAISLYRGHYPQGTRVRLLGVAVTNLTPPGRGRQLILGESITRLEKAERLQAVVDQVRSRYGDQALVRARLCRKEMSKILGAAPMRGLSTFQGGKR